MKKLWNTMNLSSALPDSNEKYSTGFLSSLGNIQTSQELKITKKLISLGNKIETLREKVNHFNEKVKNSTL